MLLLISREMRSAHRNTQWGEVGTVYTIGGNADLKVLAMLCQDRSKENDELE